ncbi:MAG TPA: protein kinase [Pyrinomonadaceae bacterium]|jgi:serine/threonine protein kinase/tetratricopeptide (TPR) repeat protein
MSSVEPERVLLHYRVLSKIGEGGMGQVYKAEDTKLGRHVALKLLAPESNKDLTAKRRLLAEAQSASVLNHPNIVTIYAIEEADGLDFIVMEFVEGETLTARLALNGALPLPSLLDIGIQVADALQAAHATGVIHRDIKPGNILITPKGVAKVTDFGLAKLVRVNTDAIDREALTLAANLTGPGVVLGTAAYMSPEQTRGETLDVRSEIFSLGSVLYEAATRTRAFAGPSFLSVIHAIAATDPAPPSKLRPELPREFDLIIERALAKDRELRYGSASEMGDALRSLRASLSGTWSGIPIVYDSDLIDRSAPSFVGREPEMRKLESLLQQAIEGTGRVVFITGEPGIGKTSLGDEFLRHTRRQGPGLLISRGRCVEQYGTGEAYLPFLDAMGGLLQAPGRERIAAVMRTYAPTWCMELPTAFASSGSLEKLQQETIGATKERMMREMGDALGILATSSPIVLLLEDLHWADPSSVDLLRHLCQRINTQRLLIVGTFRPEDVERSGHPLKSYKAEMMAHHLCEELALGSWSREHIAEYVAATFAPNDFPAELTSLIHEKTEGHPLFAANFLQYLSERGDLVKANNRWSLVRPLTQMDLEAPESVRGMISKKIDALDAEERRALQYASVEGTEFLSIVTANLLGIDEIDLEERLAHIAKTHRLIEILAEDELPDGSLTTRYRFAHALYQNFLYGDLVNKRRVALHQQAGEQLLSHYGKRAPQIATQLALHFERGRDFNRAVEYLIHAGDHAAKLYGYAEAERHYTQALKQVEKLSAEAQAEQLCTLYHKRGTVNHAVGNFSRAADDFTKMLEQAQELGALELQSAALNSLTMTLFFSHRLEETLKRAAEALEVAEQAGNDRLRADTMLMIGLKHLCYGELKEGKAILDDVVATARRLDYKPALLGGVTWRACLHFFQSEYDLAIEKAREGLHLASELRDGFLMLTALFFVGLSQGNQGKMSEALKTLQDAMEKARRNGDQFWHPRLPNCIGWIYRELHDFEAARKFDEEGVDVARRHHVLEAEANSLINRGIDCIHAGERACTDAAFTEVKDIFARDAWFRWRYNIRLQAATAAHHLRHGEFEQAREYIARLEETAREHEAHKYIAVAKQLMAELLIASGDVAGAEHQFNAALAQLKEYPAPLVGWKVHAGMARLKSRSGDTAGAEEHSARALELVNSIAANVADEKLRGNFVTAARAAIC